MRRRSLCLALLAAAAALAIVAACDDDPAPAPAGPDCSADSGSTNDACARPVPDAGRCPPAPPQLGTPCSGPVEACSYDTCGAFVGFLCSGGAWKREREAGCPVFIPNNGSACECATDPGTVCDYCSSGYVNALCDQGSRQWRVTRPFDDAGLCGPVEGGAGDGATDAGANDASDAGGG